MISFRVLPLALLAVLTASCGDDGDSSVVSPSLTLSVASGRADMVSGDDVLIAFDLPPGADPDEVVVRRNGEAVNVGNLVLADGRQGLLVDRLIDGPNDIEVDAAGATDSITVVNHPVTGPIFSGPHLPLPVCTTEANGLGPALDGDCSAATTVRWRYRDVAGDFHPLEDPSDIPDDVAKLPGSDLPFVVREESGTINRAVFWITVLDPTPTPDAGWNSSMWNGRLIYQFGGGCGTSYSQGFRLQGEPNPETLAAGYAYASATFNTLQVMCNDVLSAETMMMVKEHFAERYGVPEFTIGEGGSGGSIQQYLIGQNYPGLLDALSPTVPFPDIITTSSGVLDCALLNAFYRGAGGTGWTDTEKTAVNGHLTSGTCGYGRSRSPPA